MSTSAQDLAARLAAEIAPLPPGRRIATHRELVRRHGVSATTVAHALALLTQRGLVESRPGSGSFRSGGGRGVPAPGDTSWQEAALALTDHLDDPARPTRSFATTGLLGALSRPGPDVIDLNGGYLHPDLQPLSALTAALSRASRLPQAWDRPPAAGIPELRDWFAAEIGGGLSRHDILVCGGGQGALATVLRALGQPGDHVLVESPTYPGTTGAAHAAGLRAVPVPLDAQGIRPDHLDEALARTRARIVVVQPYAQNPTGASHSAARSAAIHELARRHGAFVVEDDFARRMVHADAGPVPEPMVAADPHGVVVHIRSLTKVNSPNLRVGAIAARGPVMARLRAAHAVDTFFVAAPLQHTALELVSSPRWTRGLTRLGGALQERRRHAVGAVVDALGPEALPVVTRGGYHLWVTLPGHLDAGEVAAAALARGVAVTPGDLYYPGDSPPPHLRLSYVAAPSSADLVAGVARLAAALPT